MKEICLLTLSPQTEDLFKPLTKSRLFLYTILAPDKFFEKPHQLTRGTLIYLDTDDLDQELLLQRVKTLSRLTQYNFGILDPKGRINDPGKLFHIGASDYIGPPLCGDPLPPTRFKDVFAFYPVDEDDDDVESLQVPFSGPDFSRIEHGKPYIFTMLYTKLITPPKIDPEELELLDQEFRVYLKETYEPLGGRIWIWNQNEGILLLPFDGLHCPGVLTAYRQVLNWDLTNAERFSPQHRLRIKMAIDIGETPYRDRGDTGTVISDAVNYIHHLGMQHADHPTLYLTQDTLPFLPSDLEDTIFTEGDFKGRLTYRMKLFNHPGT